MKTALAIGLLVFALVQVPEEYAVLEGYVLRADSVQREPVGGAIVWLESERDSRSTTTDAAGYFRFAEVLPGSHTVSTGHPGYVIARHGQRAPGMPGVPVIVSKGKKLEPLIFQLVPTGVVTGMVFDYDNEPLANVLVQLLQERYRPSGERFYAPVDGVRTDDRGVFRLYWITPGEYLLATSPRAPFGESAAKPNLTPRLDRLPTFYPGVTNPAQAVPITVRSGEVLDGRDITLSEPHRSTVQGRIIDARSGKGVQAQVRLSLLDVGILAEKASDDQGNYEFNDVPYGAYTIVATLVEGGAHLQGRENFQLGSVSLEDLDVRLYPPVRLSGKIQTEDGSTPDLGGLTLKLPTWTRVKPDGQFETEVHRGDLAVAISFPETLADYYIQSARIGPSDVLATPYKVEGEVRDPLAIVISPAAARIDGVILDAGNMPCPSAEVVLVPADQLRPQPHHFRTVRTDANGKFSLRGIAPGDYRLFAWDGIEENAYFNPEFLRIHERDSTRITLRRSETLNVRLPLVLP